MTIKAPDVEEIEFVVEVTANPEVDNISVDGLKNKVKSWDTAIPPEPETVLDGLVNNNVWLKFSDPIATWTL